MNDVDDRIRAALGKAGSVLTKTAGASLGALVAKESGMPFAGYLTGYYLTDRFKEGFDLLVDRGLSAGKRRRAADVAVDVANQIVDRVEAGESVRADGFFERSEKNRSAGDEALEATLDAAMQAFEEQKIKFISNLFSAICFDESANAAFAQRLIALVRNMSLRSLIIVRICDDVDNLGLQKRPQTGQEADEDVEALFSEYFELVGLGLVQHLENRNNGTAQAVLGSDGIELNCMRTTKLGSKLCVLANLDELKQLPAWSETIEVIKKASTTVLFPSRIDGGYTDDGTFGPPTDQPSPSGMTPEQELDSKFVTALAMSNA